MKARFAVPLIILALPLAALGFSFLSDNLLDRQQTNSPAAHPESSATAPAFAYPESSANTTTPALTVRPEFDATPWNLFAGSAALLLVLLLRRL